MILTSGTARPASVNASLNESYTRFPGPLSRSPFPSPRTSKADGPTFTWTTFQMSSAIPRQSKPGPRFAVVAGALTVMLLSIVAA